MAYYETLAPGKREIRVIATGVAQADTGQTTEVISPPWSEHALFYLSVDFVAGTTPLTDYIIYPMHPTKTAAVVVATTQAGGGGNNEVQTVTLTGGPDWGVWRINWGGVASNISVQTRDLQFDAAADEVQNALETALTGTRYAGTSQIVVTRSGAGTSGSPYVYTLTFSGQKVSNTNVDAVTITDGGLTDWQTDTNQTLGGWNGITQIAGTTNGNVQVRVSRDGSGATDDTGPEYLLHLSLPNRTAHKITFDRTTGDETYTYSLIGEFWT